MKKSNRNNNQLTINEQQFIYGKKLFKNTYYYAVKYLGQPISCMSWEKQTSFNEESIYLIRNFETRICYQFFNQKILPSQEGIRVHVKNKFCQVYIPQSNQKSKTIIQDHQWKIQNISKKLIQPQSIINQNLKDLTLNTQDSKRVVVQFAHLPPFLAENQIKQMIVNPQSLTNITQVLKQESKVERDIGLLNSIEKAQKKINEQQKIPQIQIQNEQQKINIQKPNSNNKLLKKHTKKSNSNEQQEKINKQQSIKTQSNIESSKIEIKGQSLRNKKLFQSSSEIIPIENDNQSFQLELQNLEEDYLDQKQVEIHTSQSSLHYNDNRSIQLILERSQNKNKELKKQKFRAIKSGNLQNFLNRNSQTLETSIIDNNITYSSTNKQGNDYQNNSNNDSNFNNDNDNNNNQNKLYYNNKSDNSSSINQISLNQSDNYSEEKKSEKDVVFNQIICEKQKENDNLEQMIFKEPKQSMEVKKNQQIQKDIQQIHQDKIAQNKPSRCSVPIIPRIKNVEIQVYLIDNYNESEMIQYDQELNQIKSQNLIILTICSHQLMNEQLYFLCKYDNEVEYFVEYDELKIYSPKKLLDYMILNSIFI